MLKRAILLLHIILCIGLSSLRSQSLPGVPEIKYRRSSLHTILVESDKFPRKDTVINAYNKAPFPDKYNNHTVGLKSFDPAVYTTRDSTGKIEESKIKETIEKYFQATKMANQMTAKWFSRQEDGTFDMSLIAERGSYDASDMQVNIAKGSARGTASLADAGEELIANTFVVVSQLNFVSNEPIAAAIRVTAKAIAGQMPNPLAKKLAETSADVIYKKTKEGYSVWTTAYLYQLAWNDSIAAIFYNDLWMDKSNPDAAKKEAFDKSDLLQLKFVGQQKASSLVLFSTKTRNEVQIIELATIRNIDNVFAKLQKNYDVFKTKTPLYTGFPITAKIGLKEGVEKGDKFEVLEQVVDPETGRTKYVGKGKIVVDKNLIWDNRYALEGEAPTTLGGEEPPAEEEAKDNGKKEKIDRTTFTGGKNYYPGMLIRQVK